MLTAIADIRPVLSSPRADYHDRDDGYDGVGGESVKQVFNIGEVLEGGERAEDAQRDHNEDGGEVYAGRFRTRRERP